VPIVLVSDQKESGRQAVSDACRRRLESAETVWLDIADPETSDHDLLVTTFGLSDECATEALRLGQRPRITDLDDSIAMLVLYGMSEHGRSPVELHILVSERFIVTVHSGTLSGLRDAISAHQRRESKLVHATPIEVLHHIVDSMADGYFPRLAKLDDEIDSIEEEIFDTPTDEQLQRLFLMKRELIAMRKVVTPMRDMLGAVFTGVVDLPGFDPENAGWLRDAYDHMIRISDLVDSYRDLLTGAMDVYLSTVSNRLNSVMKQLTVIATIFLPLTFVTGFFGQNFLYLTNHIQRSWTFWVFAIGIEGLIVLGMLVVFRRRRWL
jgi:magnesium transporter